LAYLDEVEVKERLVKWVKMAYLAWKVCQVQKASLVYQVCQDLGVLLACQENPVQMGLMHLLDQLPNQEGSSSPLTSQTAQSPICHQAQYPCGKDIPCFIFLEMPMLRVKDLGRDIKGNYVLLYSTFSFLLLFRSAWQLFKEVFSMPYLFAT
jgi:hypothetical protein